MSTGNELFVKACKDLCALEGLLESDPQVFWNQCDHLMGLMPEGVMETLSGSFWFLHYRALQLEKVVGAYDNRDYAQLNANPSEVIRALHDLNAEIRTPFVLQRGKLRPESSPANLISDGVNKYQVCQMWGLVDSGGNPDFEALDKEITTPGSVVNAEYLHPTVKVHEAAKRKHRSDYEKLFTRVEESRDPYAGTPACPETPEELFNQGVPSDQAAKMLQISFEEADTIWENFTSELGPQEFVPATNEAGQDVSEHQAPVFGEEADPHPMYDTEGVVDIPDKSIVGWDEDTARLHYGESPKKELREMCKADGINVAGNLSVDKLIDRLIARDREQLAQGAAS